jgi:hypothetical protein
MHWLDPWPIWPGPGLTWRGRGRELGWYGAWWSGLGPVLAWPAPVLSESACSWDALAWPQRELT